MTETQPKEQYALCIENKDCEDLVTRKVYLVLQDQKAQEEGYMRVIDESGEDYLYPTSYFILLQLPSKARKAIRVAG